MNDGQCQSDCRWPGLPAPYDAALREAVQYIEERYRPWGIVASGHRCAGAPDRTSDLDSPGGSGYRSFSPVFRPKFS